MNTVGVLAGHEFWKARYGTGWRRMAAECIAPLMKIREIIWICYLDNFTRFGYGKRCSVHNAISEMVTTTFELHKIWIEHKEEASYQMFEYLHNMCLLQIQ